MVYWIILVVILLIVLEEGLYYLSNRVAFNSPSKEPIEEKQTEKKPSRIGRLLRRRKKD